ncbi:MAG TPA: hypothetical protein VM142_04735 [Acidimicrobiales bacterium]|nr:hypothetical protein [Acidimicrobiales bacterium]
MLVGAVSLVIGFVSNSLPPIYLSIACSVIAGIVLVVFSRMSKRQEAGGPSASGFTPAPSPGNWTPPAPPPAPSYRAPATPPQAAEPEPAPARASSAAASAVAVEDFPLEGYDTLRVSQILPALDDLDLDDLDIVREREEQGKNRTTVLRRIDVLMDEREAEDGAAVTTPLEPEMDDEDDEIIEDEADFDDDDEDLLDDDLLDDDVAAVEPDRTAVIPVVPAIDESFPIPNYDNLPVAQILPLLDDLDDDELDMVAEHEEQGKNRAAILDRIDDMFEPLEDEAPAPVVTPAPRAPAKKAPAKKAPAKRATPATAPPFKATRAKKAPVRTAAVKKAAVKKVAPVKKPSPVTRTPARGVKKAAPAKRPPAAVKKVAKKR